MAPFGVINPSVSFTASEIKEIFQKIDKNGNGHIEASELVLVLRGLGQNPTDEEVAEGLKAIDRNGKSYASVVQQSSRSSVGLLTFVQDELYFALKNGLTLKLVLTRMIF